MKQQTHFIFESLESKRLDKALIERFPSYSRTYFQYLIDRQRVTINGQAAKKRTIPQQGDLVSISFLAKPSPNLTPENIPLDIIFEDSAILCVNKPAGMVVHPAPGHDRHTFVNALLYHVADLPQTEGDLRPGIVHRLDKDTSGVLIAAKTTVAHHHLVELFSSRQITKSYLAICVGNPGKKTITTRMARDPRNRQKMAVCSEKGKEATTEITTLATSEELSIVSARPITGRTHQIRVHLKELGCPILGDNCYGFTKLNQKWGVPRQLLHAYQLKLSHPLSKDPLVLTASLPGDFADYLNQMTDSVDAKQKLFEVLRKNRLSTQNSMILAR
ncbi:MAG: RluA family pseudouridine synthase [Chlamydiota bacterium]